jgi:hypothetical protein
MSLLDYFSGYHQIYMKEEDKASTSFITPFGTYCFIRMPEGLKNAGSTFSRLTKTVLESQVGRNIFTYVDDIVVASKSKEDHLADLAETFANMRDARLRLNPKKCVFGVRQGKILGYLVSHRRIEANPSKIQAIINMTPLQSARDVQRLTGRLAALNRFISKSVGRSLPFLKTLHGAKDFAWGPEQAAAFVSLKQHLSELAILTSPDPSLPLLLYVAALPHAVSVALVQEQDREGTTRQCPVYYVSEVLTTSKCNMMELEKIAYAVVMASRKLRHYFEAFKVRVTSDMGLGKLFRNQEASVRIAKWAAELSGYHITFEPRTAIKSQVLADFTRWSRDPPGFETPTVGALGRGLLRVDEQLPVKLQMGSLQQPLQPGTVLRFGSLEFMSLDGSYDIILLPPPRESDNGGRQPARRRGNRRRLPHVVEGRYSGLSRPLPRRQRRRRGNQGQAGGGTSLAVERVDGAGAPTESASGIGLASETKTSAVSPQHTNLKQTDDASTLAKDLLGVTLVPETTVQSVPDVTSSPPVDQKVPTDSHLAPFGFGLDPPSNSASVDTLIEASPNPLGYRVRSP